MPLNVRQQRFIAEYIRCGNATEAYRIAYDCDNDETAASNGWRLLRNAEIRAALAEYHQAAVREAGLTAAAWFREVALLSFSDVNDFDADANGRLMAHGAAEKTRSVSSKKVRRTVTGRGRTRRVTTETEIKLWSKTESLRMAGQALGLLRDKLEVTGADGGPIEANHEHGAADDLAPYLRVIADMAAGRLGPPPPALPANGPAQPLDTPVANGAAGPVPPQHGR